MSTSYEYDVVVNGEALDINPKDLATARELARSWEGKIIRRKVDPWEDLPAYQQEALEYTLRIGDPDDECDCVVIVTAGGVDGQEVDYWTSSMVTALASIRQHGYIIAESVGNRTYVVFK